MNVKKKGVHMSEIIATKKEIERLTYRAINRDWKSLEGFEMVKVHVDESNSGASLITIEQAHRLMSLSVSRSQCPEGYEDLIADLTREIDEIWTEVFGK